MTDRTIDLAGGRRMSFAEYGDATGPPVIALHGTPGSRLKFSSIAPAATRHGLRIIAPDRWGYGGTDAVRRPTLAGYAADVLELADRLGIERFALLGISGGGPYAAAAANVAGERLTRLALVSPVGPVRLTPPGDVSQFHRFCFLVLPRLSGVPRAAFEAYRLLLTWVPSLAVRIATSAAADRKLMQDPEQRLAIARVFQAGLARSARGPVMDIEAFAGLWDIRELSPGQARTWIGLNDQNVPVAAARTLAALMGADLVEIAGAGHYWFTAHHDDVLDWLAHGASPREAVIAPTPV